MNSQRIVAPATIIRVTPHWKWLVLTTGEDSGDWYPYSSRDEAKDMAIQLAQEHADEDCSVYLVGEGKVWQAYVDEAKVRIKGVKQV